MSLRDQAAHVDEQAVGGDAACHEVVVQVAINVQLLCGDLHKRTTWETEAFWMHCQVMVSNESGYTVHTVLFPSLAEVRHVAQG